MEMREGDGSVFWVAESNKQTLIPVKHKRKVKAKNVEFVGWGSKSLIEFLQSIGKDTGVQLSQYDVTAIIDEYVHMLNLLHPMRRKKVVCDERLRSLFGKTSVPRMKIYDLLNSHFAENHDYSEDDHLYSSEEYEDVTLTFKKQKVCSSEKGAPYQKTKTPLSYFAAIIPENIKLLYLKRSLVQVLVKHPESFEAKLLGSYIRIKSDPNDYSRKNSHQLLPVTGVKNVPGIGDVRAEVLLQVPNVTNDITICMLSDDDFSKEECEDLCQRIKDGLIKRPTVVEVEQKAQLLHKDITKHWLPRELVHLQNLINQANEKGWRKELFGHLERRKRLQTPSELTKLLTEVPKVTADKLEPEDAPHEHAQDVIESNSLPISIHVDVSQPIIISSGTHQALPSHVPDPAANITEKLVLKSEQDQLSYSDFVIPLPVKDRSKILASKPKRNYKKTIPGVEHERMKRKLNYVGVFDERLTKVVTRSKAKGKGATKKALMKKAHKKARLPFIRTRSSPRPLYNAIQTMNSAQKQAVIDMGFGGILALSFEEIPSKMGYWLVDSFDERTCKIKMEDKSLKVSKSDIHRMLGVPMGGAEIKAEKTSKADDIVTQEWRTQFGRTSKCTIRPADVVERMKNMEDSGRLFKLNFLVLFATTMAEGTKCGTCNQKFLPCIVNDEDIKKMDWCGYILECLKNSKSGWDRENQDSFYTGPLTFLSLFYVDSINCQRLQVTRRRPAIKGWTSELLRSRQETELRLGGFGKGCIEPPLEIEDLHEDDVNSGAQKATANAKAKICHLEEEKTEDKGEYQMKLVDLERNQSQDLPYTGFGCDVSEGKLHNDDAAPNEHRNDGLEGLHITLEPQDAPYKHVQHVREPNSSSISIHVDVSEPFSGSGTNQALPPHVTDPAENIAKNLVLNSEQDQVSYSDFVIPLPVKERSKILASKPKRNYNKTVPDVENHRLKRKLDNVRVFDERVTKVVRKSKDNGKGTTERTVSMKVHKKDRMSFIRTRSSPRPLYNAIQTMNSAQKQAVIDMGFGAMLDLSFDEIPAKMGYWLVDSFDERTCKIKMEDKSLKVSKSDIHLMLGVPMGGTEIRAEKTSKADDVVTQEWRTQFGRTSKCTIRPADVVERMKNMEDAGRLFKLNFLVLFATSMAEGTKCGTCNQKFLPCIVTDDDIKKMDWCGYILECLKNSKSGWDRANQDSFYTGPLTFLSLFYVDSINCQRLQVTRRRPAIKGWTSELLRRREATELKLGGFGKGCIEPPIEIEDLCKGDVNNGKQKATEDANAKRCHLEEEKTVDEGEYQTKIEDLELNQIQDLPYTGFGCDGSEGKFHDEGLERNELRNDGLEGLQVLIANIEENIQKIKDEKVKLEEGLVQALNRFPDSIELQKLKIQGENLFQ